METKDVAGVMSPVIQQWIIAVQDAMPSEMRGSLEWVDAVSLARETSRDPADERARLGLIMDWMWGVVLPVVQPVADKFGFGQEWRVMLRERTPEAARAAWAAEAVGVERAAPANVWLIFDPPGLLRRLAEVGK